MSNNTYQIVKKVHLYASLSIVTLLIMYVISSYLMIHSEPFKTYEQLDQTVEIAVQPNEVYLENWPEFLKKNHVSGRLTRENTTTEGDLVREYANAGGHFKVTLYQNHNKVEIASRKKNLAGTVVGYHRVYGFGGPWYYNVYAILLDVVGVSMILFAITGAILWLKLLKKDPFAWIIFFAGFTYVGAIVAYLMLV